MQRLQWFTHGFYAVRQRGEELLIADLRMGLEPNYAFTYSVAYRDGAGWVSHASRQVASGWNQQQVGEVLQRVIEPR